MKIEEYQNLEGVDEEIQSLGKFTITDMIRGTVHVENPLYLTDVYDLILNMEGMNIVRVVNRLQSDVPKVTLTFIYSDTIIGEIII